MPKTTAYKEQLKQDLAGLIDRLELTEAQKHAIRSRWLDQVLWMEGKSTACRRWYSLLRMTTILGGVTVPTALGLNAGAGAGPGMAQWASIGISLLVAASAAAEGFFRFGERWRHYRSSVEALKSEGWLFLQRGGPYQAGKDHAETAPAFAARVEDILRRDIEAYMAVMKPGKGDVGGPGTGEEGKNGATA